VPITENQSDENAQQPQNDFGGSGGTPKELNEDNKSDQKREDF